MPINYAPGYDAGDPFGIQGIASTLMQMRARQQQEAYMQQLMQQQEQRTAADAAAMQQQQAMTAAAPRNMEQTLGVLQQNGMGGGIDPVLQARIDEQRSMQQNYMRDLGNANVDTIAVNRAGDRAGMAAAGVNKDLEEVTRRAAIARATRQSVSALEGLSPEDMKVQTGIAEAIARMQEVPGANDNAIAQLTQHLHPNAQQRIQMEDTRQRVSNAANQSEADAVATGPMLQMLAQRDPKFAGLAQIPGLVIWGAGTELLKMGAADRESAAFRANADRDHSQTMTEIGARGAQGGGYQFDVPRSVIETALYRSNASPADGVKVPSIAEAMEAVIGELRVAAPGILTPQVEDQIRGIDRQAVADYSDFVRKGAQPQDWPDIERAALAGGRTPQTIAKMKQLFMDRFVRTGSPQMQPTR